MKNYILNLNFFASIISLYYWQIAHNDFDDFNTFIILQFHSKISHSYRIILNIIWLMFIVSLLPLISRLRVIPNYLPLRYIHITGIFTKYLIIISLVFNVSFILLLYNLWKDEWILLYKSFHFYYIYHHLLICLAIILVWIKWIDMKKHQPLGITILATTIFVGLIITSIILIPPCTFSKHHHLPHKPKIVAHRGAQYISPENTMVSYDVALRKCHMLGGPPAAHSTDPRGMKVDEGEGTSGAGIALETDVQISYDGVPFLLHDPYLFRTTDIRYKNRDSKFLSAYLFNYTRDLIELSAGSWFMEEDPFFNNKDLPADVDGHLFPNQTLPLFHRFLKLAATRGVNVIFDLKFPEECDPSITNNYTSTFDWNSLVDFCCPNDSSTIRTPTIPKFLDRIPEKFGKLFRSRLPEFLGDTPSVRAKKSQVCKEVGESVCKCRHPYGPVLTEIILDTISKSGIPQNQIWWILERKLGEANENPYYKRYPNFTYVFPDPIPLQNLTRLRVSKMNLGNYESKPNDIELYKKNNLTVNIYAVNKLWLFSYYWCLGVDSITTGKCHIFSDPSLRPIMIMSSEHYYSLVTLMNLFTLAILLFVTCLKVRNDRTSSRFYTNGYKEKL